MDESKKSKGKNSSALPVLDPVSQPVSACVTSTDGMSNDRTQANIGWLAYLTGGRPMEFIEFAFTDVVSGKRVNYYRDAFGRIYMANHSWSWFRVPKWDLS